MIHFPTSQGFTVFISVTHTDMNNGNELQESTQQLRESIRKQKESIAALLRVMKQMMIDGKTDEDNDNE